jgi:ribosomal protein L7/L12
MDEKKFKISGTPENTRIQDDEDNKEKRRETPENSFKLRLTHDDIMNIMNDINGNKVKALEELRKGFDVPEKDIKQLADSMKEYFLKNVNPDILSEIKKSKEKGNDVTEDQINELMLDIFGKPNSKGEVDVSKMLEAMAKGIEHEEEDDEEEEEEDIELDENLAMDVSTLLDPDSFKVVLFEPNRNLLEEFQTEFGMGPDYKISLFTEIKGFNLIEGLTEIESISFIEGNENYLLFRGKSKNQGDEDIIMGFIQDRGDFMLIIPSFGNTYDLESGLLLNPRKHPLLYTEDKSGNMKLTDPVDMKKIHTGIGNVLYEYKKPVLSVQQFGKVLTSKTTVTRGGNALIIGTILSSESPMSLTFKKDFSLPLEAKVFNFFIKFNRQYSKAELSELAEYLFTVDFTKNEYIQTIELKADSDGDIFIEMDLGDLPGKIIKWLKE